MRLVSSVPFVLVTGLFAGCVLGEDSQTDAVGSSGSIARLSGAVFTTLPDGSRVDANIYASKDDVYLDGGPGNGAPQKAAGLPDGDYFFQVTDPSGKVLLSSDPILCREFHVENAIIVNVGAAACSHKTGLDKDHGALTVQLMPYDDTPNPGGEYKAWVTPVGDYDLSAKQHFHGFVEKDSKTDNFKVRVVETPPPPPPPVCGDGHLDEGEQCDDGNTANGDGCSSTCTIEQPPPPPPPCCGNGTVETGEECDDGNTTSGDGCSSTCTVELPPPPPPCCGNGTVEAGEECDDGNTTSGDGCSSTCTKEPVCTGA